MTTIFVVLANGNPDNSLEDHFVEWLNTNGMGSEHQRERLAIRMANTYRSDGQQYWFNRDINELYNEAQW
jgi:hypothetical protein